MKTRLKPLTRIRPSPRLKTPDENPVEASGLS